MLLVSNNDAHTAQHKSRIPPRNFTRAHTRRTARRILLHRLQWMMLLLGHSMMMLLHAQREHGRSFSLCETFTARAWSLLLALRDVHKLCETFTSSARRSQALVHNEFARPAHDDGERTTATWSGTAVCAWMRGSSIRALTRCVVSARAACHASAYPCKWRASSKGLWRFTSSAGSFGLLNKRRKFSGCQNRPRHR